MTASIFVTGMLRSGTTLVDKLLSAHPSVVVASQPLPCLYTHLARRFLDSGSGSTAASDLLRRYPLGDLFAENHYSIEAFTGFLRSYEMDEGEWRTIEEDLRGYSGTMTEVPRSLGRHWMRGFRSTPAELIRDYLEVLDPTGDARVLGSKETLCEQFLPYLTRCGTEVVLVLRDVRDVIASLDSGRGEVFTGRRKPLLYNIRHWRKSVAFALEFQSDPRVQIIRYEDLVGDPRTALNRLVRHINLEDVVFDGGADPLRDPITGSPWRGNSSYAPRQGVTDGSVGTHREHLSPQTVRIIESACFPEMTALGYKVRIEASEVEVALGTPWPDHSDVRPELGRYLWSSKRQEEEIHRWRELHEGRFRPEYHLFPNAFTGLRAGIASGPSEGEAGRG